MFTMKHQEKKQNVRLTMELEVPKRPIFMPTLSTIVVQRVLQWERQMRFSRCNCQGSMAKTCCCLFGLINFFGRTFP